jgi:phosphoglycerate dehydrogenase-like enzyme
LGFGNIGIDLARRLKPFGVKVIATKRSWSSYAQNTNEFSKSIFLPYSHVLLLFNKTGLFFYFLTCSALFVEDDVDALVDVKGSHEDIYEFAAKADIVVCCLILNSETVKHFLTFHLFHFSELSSFYFFYYI